jgi:HB1, ASXL, restriction endonuclease HTH domain/Restriction endonuclease
MTFLEAALEILRHEGKPLHYKDLTERSLGKKLLTFVGRTPEVTMQTQLTAAVKKAPGNPFVRVKPGIFGLLRYPEVTAEERAAYAKADAPVVAVASKSPDGERGGRGRDGAGGRERDRESVAAGGRDRGRGRRRRGRGGRGGEDEPRAPRGAPVAEAGAAVAAAASGGEDTDIDAEEPQLAGLSPEARAAALAETGVLEADGDEATGDEEDETSMEDDESPVAAGAGDEEVDGDDEDEGDEEELAPGAEAGAAGEAGAGAGPRPGDDGLPGPGGEAGRRRRRRRRRGGRGGEGGAFGEGPRPTSSAEGEGTSAPRPEGTAYADAGGTAGGGAAPEAGALPSEDGQGGGAGGGSGEGQGPRRIMTPVDAALEILRGQAPGRGVHVRQIADGATRRRLVHGEPNEAWRVMRTALAAEPRERLRAGMRPRVRSAGAGLYALARRPPDAELERAEQVFGEARRALRERTAAALERRIADLPAAAFEALARVLLQREGFGPATFVKRVEGTIYVEALRGRGSRSSRCLVGFKFGPGSAGRRAIGELREGIRARGQDEGLLMLAGRLSEDAIAEWKKASDVVGRPDPKPTPPIEIADGAAMAETCIRHGVGVINTMVSVDFVDADFFADIAEG